MAGTAARHRLRWAAAVVYGMTDLDQALGDYRRWKARSP
jgi:hypothetical protein